MPTATSAPTGAPTGAPTSAPSTPPAPAGPSAGATVLDITARNIAFSPTDLTATADTPLTIHFDNEDAGVAHDVAIHRGAAGGESVFQGDTITGVASTDYDVPSLPAGTYTIICIVHPTQMIATLTVK
jgi:plastocyanin